MIELVVRNRLPKGQIFYYEPPTTTFVGEQVPNPDWVAADCITIVIGERLHIIKRNDIVGSPQIELPPEPKTWQVDGSKPGSVYDVKFQPANNYWSCTCTGFSFRNDCKHVRLKKAEEVGAQ